MPVDPSSFTKAIDIMAGRLFRHMGGNQTGHVPSIRVSDLGRKCERPVSSRANLKRNVVNCKQDEIRRFRRRPMH